MKRARREFKHRAGRGALRVTGNMPTHPAWLTMSNDLHDHMASVTIEMPKRSVALWANGVWHWQGDRSAPAHALRFT